MTTTPMTVRMVDTIGQYQRIQSEIDAAVTEVIHSGMYINGPAVKSFKANLAEYLGAKHVIPCGNGTDALQIALMSLGLEVGDEVITTPFTFIATAEVIALLGLKPVFVDIGNETFNLDAAAIEAVITDKTKVIMPVHLFGQPAEMKTVMDVAAKHNLYVIEDNAQAIGSDYVFPDGTKVKAGMVGHIGCTSFYPSKNLGAYGDGGAIFTNDDALAEQLACIANHGMKRRYYHDYVGINSRLDSVQAAILDVKLKYLDEYNAARAKAADLYDSHFGPIEGLVTPVRKENCSHVFHQYTLRVLAGREKRDAIREGLNAANIPSGVYYPVSLHLQTAYQVYGYKEGDFPVSEKMSEEVISLPMHSELDEAQVAYVAKTFIDLYNKS